MHVFDLEKGFSALDSDLQKAKLPRCWSLCVTCICRMRAGGISSQYRLITMHIVKGSEPGLNSNAFKIDMT